MGGYLEGNPERSTLAGLRSLRTARVLAEGQVGTFFLHMYMKSEIHFPGFDY